MALHASNRQDANSLHLCVQGNLDFSLAPDIFRICESATASTRSCVVDLSSVDRVFDSGVAMLHWLFREMGERGAAVVVVTDSPHLAARL